jgi:hypothetical protein
MVPGSGECRLNRAGYCESVVACPFLFFVRFEVRTHEDEKAECKYAIGDRE